MEKNNEIDGGSYDFGARMYDGRVGRWWAVDLIAEKYTAISPFVFALNSPLQFIDPNGKWVARVIKQGKRQTLIFEAEEGDDVETLAMQLGISSKAILEVHPELSKVATAQTFTLNQLEQVQAINNTINAIEDDWNCANFCAYSKGKELKEQFGDFSESNLAPFVEMLKTDFTEVSEEDSKIGSIIYYDYTKDYPRRNEAAEKELSYLKGLSNNSLAKELKKRGFSESLGEIKKNLKSDRGGQIHSWMQTFRTLQRSEKHFGLVLLKDKQGVEIQSVIQQRGKVYDGVKDAKFNTEEQYLEINSVYDDKNKD